VSVDVIASRQWISRDIVYPWIGSTGLSTHPTSRYRWEFRLSDLDAWARKGSSGEVPETGRPDRMFEG
jgi:hypothetical protein